MENKLYGKQNSIICYSFLIAGFSTVLVCYLLSFFPDRLDEQMILASFVHPLSSFTAETSEKLQFILGVLTFVVSYFFTGLILKNKSKNLSDTEVDQSVLYFFFFSLAVYVFSRETIYINTLPSVVRYVFILSLFLLTAIMLIRRAIHTENKIKTYKKAIPILNLCLLVIGIVSLFVVSSFFFRDSYFYGSRTVEHHTDAYFYPIWKVWSGQYPLVDFTSLYGYYPYFFVAILSLFGGVSLKGFSVVISVLVFAIFLCIFYVLWSVCKNKVIALLGLLSIEYIMIMYNSEISEDYYLQYLPHRMISLCVILAISCAYINYLKKHKKPSILIEISGWICAGVSLLWNLDTGLVAWLGWAVFLCYIRLLISPLFKKETWIYVIRTIFILVFVACLSFFFLLLLTYVLSGQWVSLAELFWGQNVFYSSGFFMIKMKLFHPWLVIMFIYAFALAVAFSKVKDHRLSAKVDGPVSSAMYLITAVIGVGAFLYFQGRSHNFVFVVVVWPALILLTMFLDRSWSNRKEILMGSTKNVRTMGFVMVLSVLITLSFGWFHNLISPNYLRALKDRNPDVISGIDYEVNTIEAAGLSADNLELLTAYAAETYAHYNVRYMPPVQAEVDIFSYEHIDEIMNLLDETTKDVIISDKIQGYLMIRNAEEFNTLLSETFDVEKVEGFLVCKQKTTNGGK